MVRPQMNPSGDSIVVGTQVLVNNKHKAIVRYVGPTSFAEGIWYGLELEREIGKHEGTVLGVTYFTTPKKRGTFVRRENLSTYDQESEALGKVQSAMRMTLAKKKVKQEVAWRAFNALDADDENQHLQRRQRLMNSALGQRLNRDRPDANTLEKWEKEAAAMPVESEYDGPHIYFPITEEQIVSMLDAFKQGKQLHYRYAFQLVSAYRRYANDLPTLIDVQIEPGAKLTLCGDTHGQLQDLFSVFTVNGVPSPSNRYLMNGDFVDRGDYSCEILFTLMAYVLLYPGEYGTAKNAACLLNRGNHESNNQNVTGGFMMEVLDKYSGSGEGDPERGLRMYDLFQSAFDTMPLAHVISSGDRKVFVTHGGLMQRPGITFSHIAAIKRKREIPYGLPAFEDKLFEDLMWSDPRPANGTIASDRGAGVFFGPDVTEKFCANNGVSLVIRSHECVPEGYQYLHENRLLTVFSASRYCGRGTNRGAFVVFESDLTHSIQQYVAGSLSSTVPSTKPVLVDSLIRNYDLVTAVSNGTIAPAGVNASVTENLSPNVDSKSEAAQGDAIKKMIVERIVLHKSDLYFFWSHADKAGANDGCISKMQWAEGMRTVMNVELPWLALANTLVEFESDGRINYTRFLDRYRIAMREQDLQWMEGIIERASEKLFSVCHTLEAAYSYFDVDQSGVIEFEELEKGLTKMDIGLSRSQIYELMNSMDTDKDGRIQFNEFANRFRLVFSRVQDDNSAFTAGNRLRSEGQGDLYVGGNGSTTNQAVNVDEWTREALTKVGLALFKGGFGSNSPAIFAKIDTDGDGLLSADEFIAAMKDLGLGFTNDEMFKIIDVVDANKSGNINYLEFVSAFKVADLANTPVTSYAPVWDGSSNIGSGNAANAGGAAAAPRPSNDGAERSWQRGVIEQIISTLYEYRVELAAAFRMFDLDGNGVISAEEFRQGLQALTGLTGSPITDMQADEMLKALDTDNDGSINYEEFVGAFKLVDAHSSSAPLEPNLDPSANRL